MLGANQNRTLHTHEPFFTSSEKKNSLVSESEDYEMKNVLNVPKYYVDPEN